MEHIKLASKIDIVAADVQYITNAANHTGLIFNASKYEIVTKNFDQIKSYPLKRFQTSQKRRSHIARITSYYH